MAVQLGMVIGMYAFPSFLLLHCSAHPAINSEYFNIIIQIRLYSDGPYDRCRKSRKSGPKGKKVFSKQLDTSKSIDLKIFHFTVPKKLDNELDVEINLLFTAFPESKQFFL